MSGNFDELARQIEADELRDQIDVVLNGEETDAHQTKMTVIDYARARGLQPQLVYYYVRTNKIKQEKCVCGRWVIDIVGAEEFFNDLEKKRAEKRSGVKK